MTTPNIPPELGRKVTTREISYSDLVIRQWGSEWNKPDLGYIMSNGSKKDNTDRYKNQGIYGVVVLSRMLLEQQSNETDLTLNAIELEDGSGILGLG